MKTTFQGEIQLAGWSESHNGGCKVTFWLADPTDLDAFRAMTVRKGNTAGQRLACVLVEIGDDEQPVEPPSHDDLNKQARAQLDAMPVAKGGALAKLAGQWCDMPEFRAWVERAFPYLWGKTLRELPADTQPDQLAAEVIRRHCGIASRAELDHDRRAADQFNAAIRVPFMQELQRAQQEQRPADPR